MCLGIPGEVIEYVDVATMGRQARVRFGGIVKIVNMDFAPEAKPHDYVIVHVGFAISVIQPEHAQKILDTLEQLGGSDEVP